MSLRIAMTGSSGFIGRPTLDLLLQGGHSLTCLVRKVPAPIAGVRYVQGSLTDQTALANLMRDADVVIHLAGVVAGTRRRDFFDVNVDGTMALANAAAKNGVKRFIYVSSLAAREPDLNDYAASKAEAERLLARMGPTFPVVVLRPSGVYGPGDAATLPLLKAMLSKIAILPSSDKARFGLIHVSDVARIISEAATGHEQGLFELDDGQGAHTWPELIALTRQHFGRPNHVFYLPQMLAMFLGTIGDVLGQLRGKAALINSGQLRQVYHPDWSITGQRWPGQSQIPLQLGLPQTIRWYQQQGQLPLTNGPDTRRQTQDTQ